MAEQQGLEQDQHGGFQLTPEGLPAVPVEAADAASSARCRRRGPAGTRTPVVGEGAVETAADQAVRVRRLGHAHGHPRHRSSTPCSATAPGLPVRLKPEDIVIHRTRNNPEVRATCVLLDMSGSMRYDGQYVNVKRMGLALDGLIRSEYPGDYLQFIEMYTFAKPRHVSEVAELMPKPVTIYDPVVRLQGGHERPEHQRDADPAALHQHPARAAAGAAVPGDPGHAEPADDADHRRPADGPLRGRACCTCSTRPTRGPRRRRCARRMLCAREGITINIFLLPSWNQSEEDVRFAYRLAEATKGRVFFTAGRDLDRYVVWDYVKRKKSIVLEGERPGVSGPRRRATPSARLRGAVR